MEIQQRRTLQPPITCDSDDEEGEFIPMNLGAPAAEAQPDVHDVDDPPPPPGGPSYKGDDMQPGPPGPRDGGNSPPLYEMQLPPATPRRDEGGPIRLILREGKSPYKHF